MDIPVAAGCELDPVVMGLEDAATEAGGGLLFAGLVTTTVVAGA